MLLTISLIAMFASIIGAFFAIWRWTYALKAYELQQIQLEIQRTMLKESRKYWIYRKNKGEKLDE